MKRSYTAGTDEVCSNILKVLTHWGHIFCQYEDIHTEQKCYAEKKRLLFFS